MPNRARTPIERDLEAQQKRVTIGEIARQKRDAIAFQMWTAGMTQREIAERLDRADRDAGGTGVSHGMTQKLLYRLRKEREAELVVVASARRRRAG